MRSGALVTGGDVPQAPPGWYVDSDEPGVSRYWDGSAWAAPSPDDTEDEYPTIATSPVSPPASSAPLDAPAVDVLNHLARQSSVFWLGLLSCVLMAVGGLGTWATALGIVSIPGTRGDGWLIVGAGVAGACALWGNALRPRAWLSLAALLFGVAAASVGGYDLHRIAGIGSASLFGENVQLVHPAWGSYVAVGASVALAGFSLAVLILGPDDDGDGFTSNAPVALVTIAIAIGVVLVVSHMGTKRESASTEAAAATTPAETPTTAEATSEPTEVNTQQAQQVLKEYAADYSAESTRGLSRLFAEDLQRRDGSHPSENLSQALATYRTQFLQLRSPTYELSEPEVTQEQGGATAQATYSIKSQNGTVGGSVTFHLVPNGSAVAIDRLTVTPNP